MFEVGHLENGICIFAQVLGVVGSMRNPTTLKKIREKATTTFVVTDLKPVLSYFLRFELSDLQTNLAPREMVHLR